MTAPKSRRRQRGEGGIGSYKTQAGERFYVKYRMPAADGLGERQVMRRGFTSRAEAAKALRAALAEIDRGQHIAPSRLTLGAYLTDQWLPSLRLKASTEASYRKNVRLHVIPHLGGVELSRLTGQRLSALYKRLETSGRADGEGGLSARTVRYIHTILHRALRDAVEDGLLLANPADRAKPPTSAQAKAPELRYWTPAQLGAFLAWSEREGDELHVAWQLLAATGIRRGEALALRWSDVDFANAQVSVRRSAVLVKTFGAGERIEIAPPKSGKARVISLDPHTVAALKAHRSLLAGLDLRLARDEALVLPSTAGEVRHPERFSRTFATRLRQARRALGEDVAPPVIRLHDLRHTHATALLLAGVHPKIVQERLGHATISITLDTYSHVIPSMQRGAAESFAAAVYGA